MPAPSLDEVSALLRQAQPAAAITACEQLTVARPTFVDGWLLLSRCYQQLSQFENMRRAAQSAYTLAPTAMAVSQRLIECHIYCGDMALALPAIADAEAALLTTPAIDDTISLVETQAAGLQQLAQLYSHCAAHKDANRCYRTACALQPDHPAYRYNLAASQLAVGDLTGAETSLDCCLKLTPHDYDARYLRSTLRRQSAEQNHIAELEALLANPRLSHQGAIALNYALGKEREDIGDHALAFQAIHHAAQSRRQRLNYRVETDLAAMAAIAAAFDASRFATPKTNATHPVTPIFVLGLPRSGTTLVDRILCSHSEVDSLGEINDLAFAVIRSVGRSVGHSANKLDLIKRSAETDHDRVGQEYRRSTAGYGRTARWLVDKTPLNFLYLGLIHLALPDAKIVHLRRHPLDSCYAMYKTLFRMGYPFSYDFDDMARYFAGYQRLMTHWRTVLPNSFLDLDYEQLVSEQQPSSQRLLAHCALEWQAGCLNFHRNERPAATASAAQVRQPLHQRSVQHWKHYRAELAPLATALRNQGVELPEWDLS